MSGDYSNINSMIIGADNDSDSHLTLSDSLNHLWNSVHISRTRDMEYLVQKIEKDLLGCTRGDLLKEGCLLKILLLRDIEWIRTFDIY